MGKKIKNEIKGTFTVLFEEGDTSYHIEDVSMHYGLSCEHGIATRRGLALARNQEVQNIVKDFLEEGMKQVDIQEGIPEADSLLDYNGAPDNLTVLGTS